MTTGSHNQTDFAPELDFSSVLTNPILDIAARFWEKDRYHAFQTVYRAMRMLDDLVDDRKSASDVISITEQEKLSRMISGWIKGLQDYRLEDPFGEKLLKVIDTFRIPLWPFERLAKAMTHDLSHNGFDTFPQFLRYCEGAAIAPASVFMHLCGLVRRSLVGHGPVGRSSEHDLPNYDIRKAARSLAMFSYLVHIIRDFQKDQKAGLNYFAADLLFRHRIDRQMLRDIANGGEIPSSFRAMIDWYKQAADRYRLMARNMIDSLKAELEPRYALSLEIIYSLYLQIFERINPISGTFTADELNPSEAEIKARIEATIASSGLK